VPDAGRHLLVDGEVLELADAGARRLERVAAGRTWLERDAAFATVAESVIRERRSLAHRGLAAVVMALDAAGALAAVPQVRGRGASGLAGREAEVAGEAARALEGMAGEDRLDPDRVEAAVARAVRAWFRREGKPRPAVQVVVVAI
jgi:mRNA degradation ribonuclease J1/J2